MCRSVAPSRLELEHDLAGGVALNAFIGKRRASDISAQLLEGLALVSVAAHRGVQAEPMGVGA